MRAAVFLDRDGTLIEHVHYLNDPKQVRLLPDAAEAVRMLRSLDYACVVVTNQSAVARGMLTLAGLESVHAEMNRQLLEHDARLDGIYFCPHAPASADRRTVDHPDRKPGPGMLQRAAREMGLDLGRSWMVGDMQSDMLAGRNAGCRATVLVRTGPESDLAPGDPSVDHVAGTLLEAARLIAGQSVPNLLKGT